MEANLLTTLDKEIRIYERLLVLQKIQTEALNRFMTGEIEQAVNEQDSLVRKAAALEEDRCEIIHQINHAFGESKHMKTISELLPLVSHDIRNRLRQKADHLLVLVSDLRRCQKTNAHLIDRSAEYIREFIENLVERIIIRNSSYRMDGRRDFRKETPAALMDQKV
jgi:flagellar biosynthesis/type III secretory pathway chaperone